MNDTIKKNILQFLSRTELKGSEVPAYIECVNALQQKTEAKEEPIEKDL